MNLKQKISELEKVKNRKKTPETKSKIEQQINFYKRLSQYGKV